MTLLQQLAEEIVVRIGDQDNFDSQAHIDSYVDSGMLQKHQYSWVYYTGMNLRVIAALVGRTLNRNENSIQFTNVFESSAPDNATDVQVTSGGGITFLTYRVPRDNRIRTYLVFYTRKQHNRLLHVDEYPIKDGNYVLPTCVNAQSIDILVPVGLYIEGARHKTLTLGETP